MYISRVSETRDMVACRQCGRSFSRIFWLRLDEYDRQRRFVRSGSGNATVQPLSHNKALVVYFGSHKSADSRCDPYADNTPTPIHRPNNKSHPSANDKCRLKRKVPTNKINVLKLYDVNTAECQLDVVIRSTDSINSSIQESERDNVNERWLTI